MKSLLFKKASNKFRLALRITLAMGLAFGVSACVFDDSVNAPSNVPTGYVKFDLRLSRTDKPLGKASTADTSFELDSVLVVLSTAGAPSQSFSYPISGRSDLASLPVSLPPYPLAALRNWKAVIYSIDTTLNPTRRDTVHIDSVFFGVRAGDTAAVVKTVSPAFSILRARFVSNQSDSIGTGMRFVRLRVNGVTRDSLDLSTMAANLHAVHFATASAGYAVGEEGLIRKTVNGGSDWTDLSSGTTQNLNAVWFTGANNGWIGGANGLIRKTTDGANWTTQTSGTNQGINRFFFADADDGWAFGDSGTMLRTTNGGDNWTALAGWDLFESGTTVPLRAVDFVDASTGYVVGSSGLIRKTVDGGQSWVGQASNVSGAVLNAVSFAGTIGVAAGSGGAITFTTNGGANWTGMTRGSTAYYGVYNNGTRAWVVGDNGNVRWSIDGTTWTSATNTGSTNYRGVFFRNNNLGWIVGAQGVIRKTTSSTYAAWTQQALNGSNQPLTAQALNCVWFFSDTHGWAVGNSGTVLRTTNGGTNWTLQTGTNIPASASLTGVWFVSTLVGYASGSNGIVYKSVNGGVSWTAQNSNTDQVLTGIDGVGADQVWVSGEGGAISGTLTGGAPLTTKNLNGAYFRGNVGYVVGDAGAAFRTNDGGNTWTVLTGGSSNNLNAVFSTGNYAYVVGDAGTIRTIPYDQTSTALTARTSNTTANLYGVWGSPTVSSTRMYAVGDGGEIRYITSYDGAWASLTSGTTESLRAMHCTGTSITCWAVGANDAIVKSTNGTNWTVQGGGIRTFDEMLAYKYLKPGVSTPVVLQAIDRVSPLRGYQLSLTLNVGAGVDSTLNRSLTRCGGTAPACIQ